MKKSFLIAWLVLLPGAVFADWRKGMLDNLEEDREELGVVLPQLMPAEYQNIVDLYLLHRRVDFLSLFQYEMRILADLKKEHFENSSRLQDLQEDVDGMNGKVNLSFADLLGDYTFLVESEKLLLGKLVQHEERIAFALEAWTKQNRPEVLALIKKNREPLEYFPRPYIETNRNRNGMFFNLSYTYAQVTPNDPHHVSGSGIMTSNNNYNITSQIFQAIVSNIYYTTNDGEGGNGSGTGAAIAAAVTAIVTGYEQERFEKKLQGKREKIEDTFDAARQALDVSAIKIIADRSQHALALKTEFDVALNYGDLLRSVRELRANAEKVLNDSKTYSERELTLLYEDLKKRIDIPTEVIVDRYFSSLKKTHATLKKYFLDAGKTSLALSEQPQNLDEAYQNILAFIVEDARIVDEYLDSSSYSQVQNNPFYADTVKNYPVSKWTALIRVLKRNIQDSLFHGGKEQ